MSTQSLLIAIVVGLLAGVATIIAGTTISEWRFYAVMATVLGAHIIGRAFP